MRRALALVVLAAVAAGCGSSGVSNPPADQGVAAAQKLTVRQRYAQAKPVAVKYMTALAMGNTVVSQNQVGISGYDELSSLDRLSTWFSDIPVKKLRVVTTAVRVPDKSAVGVRVTMTARLGPAPLTQWVKLGERTLLVQDQESGWRVLADITSRPLLHSKIYGLSLMAQPHFLSSKTLSVVYATDDAQRAALVIHRSGEAVVKMLHAKYGGGTASAHPLIYLVAGLKQGELLGGVKIGRKETPDGWEYNGFAYIDYPVWLNDDIVLQDSVVAHELTHVATERMLAGAPHSLLEGIAMYQEEKYLNSLGYRRPFDLINAYYRRGWPSAEMWGLRYADWGQRNPYVVEAAYEDGEAMTAVIMEQHGGVPALRRLGAAFRRYHKIRYSQAEVESAFQSALGVSFDTVVAEAHAYAAARN